MKIKIISIGNNPPKWVQEILTKYISRFDDHFKFELIEIKSEKKFKSVEQKKIQETLKIFKFIDTDFIVSLDENGASCSSKDFSKKLSNWMQNFPKVTFIIGGADGLDKRIIEKSNWVCVPVLFLVEIIAIGIQSILTFTIWRTENRSLKIGWLVLSILIVGFIAYGFVNFNLNCS